MSPLKPSQLSSQLSRPTTHPHLYFLLTCRTRVLSQTPPPPPISRHLFLLRLRFPQPANTNPPTTRHPFPLCQCPWRINKTCKSILGTTTAAVRLTDLISLSTLNLQFKVCFLLNLFFCLCFLLLLLFSRVLLLLFIFYVLI